MVFVNCIILFFDISGLLFYKWGTQIYINMIETAIISLVIMALQIAELCKLKKYLQERPGYDQV
jgi:hypothetical protein